MPSSIWINSHEQIILKIPYLDIIKVYLKYNIEITTLKKRVKMQVILCFCIPVLPHKLPISKS